MLYDVMLADWLMFSVRWMPCCTMYYLPIGLYCRYIILDFNIQNEARHRHSQSNRRGVGGRRNELREIGFFERIRGIKSDIGRHIKFPCDKIKKKRNVLEYDTICVQI